MRIRLSELRRMIREALKDLDEDVPGRWRGTGPVGDEDLERLGNHGQRRPVDLEEDDDGVTQ